MKRRMESSSFGLKAFFLKPRTRYGGLMLMALICSPVRPARRNKIFFITNGITWGIWGTLGIIFFMLKLDQSSIWGYEQAALSASLHDVSTVLLWRKSLRVHHGSIYKMWGESIKQNNYPLKHPCVTHHFLMDYRCRFPIVIVSEILRPQIRS